MTEEAEYEGGCLCGQVRYQIRGAPIDAGYCHCRICQRASGAPVVAWATFPIEALKFTQGTLHQYRSSASAAREFCGHCGTPIAFHALEKATVVDISLASLDDPASLTPQYHIWTMSQMPWLHIADDLPRYPDQGPDVLV